MFCMYVEKRLNNTGTYSRPISLFFKKMGPFSFKKFPLFYKKMHFLANNEHCPKFLDYALNTNMCVF